MDRNRGTGPAPGEDVAEPELSDVELLERLAAGDEEAFVCLYRRWQAPLHRFAIAMTGSPHAAEDVMQETFMVLMQDAGRYDPGRGPLGAYLRGIARHLVSPAYPPRVALRGSRGFAESLDALLSGARDPDPAEVLIQKDDVSACRRR